MKNSIPKRTENIILEAEKSILKEGKDKKKIKPIIKNSQQTKSWKQQKIYILIFGK